MQSKICYNITPDPGLNNIKVNPTPPLFVSEYQIAELARSQSRVCRDYDSIRNTIHQLGEMPRTYNVSFSDQLTRSSTGISEFPDVISSASLFRDEPDCPRRVSAFDILRYMWADTAATIIQKHLRGRWGRIAGEKQRQRVLWLRKAVPAAVNIQKAWRGWLGRRKTEFFRMVATRMRTRRTAAIKMQSSWRGWCDRLRYRIRRLAQILMCIRDAASRVIQRVIIGTRTRRLLDDDYEKWVIKWNWDKPGAFVEVVGDFTNPPWTRRIPMKYCNIRECFVCTLPRIEGRYELKFIVNGGYVCDGAETVISDGSGHYNNVVRIQPRPPEPPFRKIRRCLEAAAHTERELC